MTLYTLEKPYNGMVIEQRYNFKSPQAGKAHFCNKILERDEVDPVSGDKFEEMGDFLSKYSSTEKCYIVRAYYTAASDYYRWLHKEDKWSGKAPIESEVVKTSSFTKIYELCQKLSSAVQNKIDGTSYSKALVSDICCETEVALHKPAVFSCTEPKVSYLDAMPLIGCSDMEDVCDGGRFDGYSYFKADKSTNTEF